MNKKGEQFLFIKYKNIILYRQKETPKREMQHEEEMML
jgi:hypothetical protein